jgi:NADH-quinone oxidoreductase subunit A
MFIVVDLDLAFLYPYAVANDHLGLFGFWSLIVFLAVFAIGFLYDWRMGALEWE